MGTGAFARPAERSEARLDPRPRDVRISTKCKRVAQAFQACVKSSNVWNRALAPEVLLRYTISPPCRALPMTLTTS